MTNAILWGKPDAGNPHVRFDEGEVASAKPRRGSLLYKDAGLHEMAEAVIGVIAAIMAFTCLSETPDYSQWVQMVTSDSTNATGIVSTGRPKCSWTQGSYWADDTAPNSNKSYFVPAGFTIFGPESSWSDNWTFPGKALAVAGSILKRNSSGRNLKISELHLLSGATLDFYQIGGLDTDDLYIKSTRANPVVFLGDCAYTYCAFAIGGRVHGNSEACIELRHADAGLGNCNYALTGDWSDFHGTVLAGNTKDGLSSEANYGKSFAGMPGTLAACNGYTLPLPRYTQPRGFGAEKGGTLLVTEDCTAGRIVIGPGGVMKFKFASGAASVVTVSNELALAVGSQIALDGWTKADIEGTPKEIALFVLSGDAAKTDPDLSKVAVASCVGGLPRAYLKIVERADVKTVVLTWDKPIVTLIKQPSDDNWTTDGSYWSNGLTPQSGFDYLVADCSAFSLNESYTTDLPFNGDSLALETTVYIGRYGIDCKEVIFGSCSPTFFGSDTAKRFQQPVTFADGKTSTFVCYQAPNILFAAPIKGKGTASFTLADWHDEGTRASVTFQADSPDFGGRIILNTPNKAASGKRPATPDIEKGYFVSCTISTSGGLGGAYTASDDGYNAVTLKNYSRLTVADDMTFDEPTRGFLIDGGGTFNIPAGKTLSFKTKLTYKGRLRKTGKGILKLGGVAHFTSESNRSEFSKSENELEIVEGALMPVAAAATDGLAIRFDDDSALILDASSTDNLGLSAASEGSSVTLATKNGDLSVGWSNAETCRGRNVSLAMCTVSPTTADSLEGHLVAARLPGHAPAVYSRRTNDDGSVTLLANYETSGLVVIIR